MTTPKSHLSHPSYRPDIDGLRAVAVLSVVAFHAFPDWLKGGFIGVDVFFVISGFLISSIIFESLEKGTFSFSEFYARRVKRIFPALSIVLVFCILFGYFSLLPDELNQLGKHVAAGAGFVSNFVLWSESGYFDNVAETKPLLHLWSLGIEEQFYIVWPFLLWVAFKIRLNLLFTTALLLLMSFALNLWMIDQNPVATFYSPLTRFWELLFGALLAWLSVHKASSSTLLPCLTSNRHISLASRSMLSNIFSIGGAACLILGFFFISKDFSFPGGWALVPVMGTLLIIVGGPKAWINRKILSHSVLIWIGLISFPLYLWHWPILSFGRVIYLDTPPLKFRWTAIFVSFLLAWLTMKFIEKPLRFGVRYSAMKVGLLSGMLASLALVGLVISNFDLSNTHTFDQLRIKRKDEHAIGSSLAWYRGKDDWLFLGNYYDHTVAKLKLSEKPREEKVDAVKNSFLKISESGAKHGIKTVLIMGPNKSSIYPEYLPETLTPSATKYSSFFLNKLREVPGLTVYDPTLDLLAAKETEGLLYWKTDTHWNNKGAFLTYAGFAKLFNAPIPKVDFKQGAPHSGDLIEIAKLKNYPLHPQDSWDIIWQDQPAWIEKKIPNEEKTAFGEATLVTNAQAPSSQYVWVVGDSFAGTLKQYFNASFREVLYVGHWMKKIDTLPEEINMAERKPDLIVVIRVERSF